MGELFSYFSLETGKRFLLINVSFHFVVGSSCIMSPLAGLSSRLTKYPRLCLQGCLGLCLEI